MQFQLNESQLEIQAMVREFTRREVTPYAEEIDVKSKFRLEIFQKMGEAGILGIVVPEAYGGIGADYVSWCLAVEEINKGSAAVGNALTLTTSMINYLLLMGSEAQKRIYLTKLVAGEKFCSFGLTEPQAGSDAKAVKSRIEPHGDGYRLNGQKTFTTGAKFADYILVVAVEDPVLGTKGISAFMVDMDSPGVEVGDSFDMMGMRGMGTAEVFFSDVRIDQEQRLGPAGGGLRAILSGLDGPGRLGAAAQAIGTAIAAFDYSVKYAHVRKQFGETIASFQAMQQKIASMSIDIQAARLIVYKAAELTQKGLPHTREVSEAKVFASDACMRVTTEAMQILGGYAYVKEYPVERYFRDAKIHQIWDGTNEIQRMLIARNVSESVAIGQDLF